MATPYLPPPGGPQRAPVSTPRFDRGLSVAAYRVYLILRDLRDDGNLVDRAGWIIFSPSALAALNDMPRNEMFRGLRELSTHGHIERGRRGRRTTARIRADWRTA